MKSLFVDTTGAKMRVAYVDGGRVVQEFSGTDGTSQSAEIFGAIANVLGNVRVADLDFMVVLGGPGSFTGIRLGLSVAKGFHLALGLPVVVVNNFRAIFYSMDVQDVASASEFYITIPAGVNDIYVAKFDANGHEVVAGRIVKRADFVADLPVVDDGVIVPERVVSAVEKSLCVGGGDIDDCGNWRKNFVQERIEPTYIKPHYAKVKAKPEI